MDSKVNGSAAADGECIVAREQVLVGNTVEGNGWCGESSTQRWRASNTERAGCREGCRQVVVDLQVGQRHIACIVDGDGHRYIECTIAVVNYRAGRLADRHARHLREGE